MDERQILELIKSLSSALQRSMGAAAGSIDSFNKKVDALEKATGQLEKHIKQQKAAGTELVENLNALSSSTSKMDEATKKSASAAGEMETASRKTATGLDKAAESISEFTSAAKSVASKLSTSLGAGRVAGAVEQLAAGINNVSFDPLNDKIAQSIGALSMEKVEVSQERLTTITRALTKDFIALCRAVRCIIDLDPCKNAAPAHKPAAADASHLFTSTSGAAGGGPPPVSVMEEFDNTSTSLSRLRLATEALAVAFRGLAQSVGEYHYLLARGIGTPAIYGHLATEAALAGMSLRDYTKILEDNSVVVARTGSFREFTKRLDATSDQLAEFGAIGQSAKQLGATMMASATTLGIPQQQVDGLVKQQIKTFGDLRRSTMMTATAFEELIVNLSQNQHVQEQLMGLAPQERAARMQQLTQLASLGHQMGLSKEAAAALTQAFLEQRKATAPERFKAAGVVRQGGAIVGMSAAESEELARFARIKDTSKLSPEELKRYQELAAQYKGGIERMKSSGIISQENIAETLEAQMPSHLAQMAQAAGVAQLTRDSKDIMGGQRDANADFANSTNKFEQGVIKFAQAVEGFSQSALGSFLTQVIPGLLAIGVAWKALGVAKAATTGGAALAAAPAITTGAAAATAAGATAAAAGGGVISSLLGGIKASAVAAGAAAVKVGGTVLSALVSGIKTAFSFLKPLIARLPLISAIFGGIEEMFTGSYQTAMGLGEGWMSKISGILLGAFTGIFTAIPRLLDSLVQGLFGFDLNSTGVVEYLISSIVDGWKMIISSVLAGVGKVFSFFGGDTIGKKLADASHAVDESIAKSSENREKLAKSIFNREGKTLRDIGEEEQKKADAHRKKLAAQANHTTQVIMGIENAGIAALKYASEKSALAAKETEAAASPASQQTAKPVAAPTSSPISKVTEPAVNTEDTKVERKQVTEENKIASQQSGFLAQPDAIAVLQEQLATLKAMLEIAQGQAGVSEEALKKMSRGRFTSNDKMFYAITGGHPAA